MGFILEIFKKYGMETSISFVFAIVTITVIPITWIDSLPFEKQNIYWALLFAVVFGLIILRLCGRLYVHLFLNHRCFLLKK